MEKQVVKQDYVSPSIEIVEFQLEDSIATSGEQGASGAAFWEEWD